MHTTYNYCRDAVKHFENAYQKPSLAKTYSTLGISSLWLALYELEETYKITSNRVEMKVIYTSGEESTLNKEIENVINMFDKIKSWESSSDKDKCYDMYDYAFDIQMKCYRLESLYQNSK